ncbi:MAG: AAA family ATPase [Candidatus Helarchaeota archaeon]|nr:AAA family ATPase [Candidatus Helarchaeota archaeon]
MSVKNIMKEELKRTSLFRDETKLSIDYTPLDLPHREEPIRKLAHLFKSLIENPGGASKKVIITGTTGTGKTAVTKRFGVMIQEVAEENSIYLRYVHINCRRYKTSFMVLNRIIQHFNPKFPKRGFNVAELVHILSNEILDKEDAYILLCLDETDLLILSEPSIIYNLTRMHDDSLNSKQRLSLITIAKSDLFKKNLDPSISSTFQCSTIHLEKYSSLQLRDILKERIKEAFFDGTVLNETINLISDFTAESGDARYALELLWLAGKYADDAKSLQITPEFARQAKVNLDPGIKREVIRDLGLHLKLILLATTRQLKNTQKAYAIMGEIEAAYRLICEEYSTESHSIKPRGHTKIWEYIRELTDISEFLSTKVSSLEDKPGQTTLLRLNVPIEILEQILEDEIKGEFKLS